LKSSRIGVVGNGRDPQLPELVVVPLLAELVVAPLLAELAVAPLLAELAVAAPPPPPVPELWPW
jgi:hypothetical protein